MNRGDMAVNLGPILYIKCSFLNIYTHDLVKELAFYVLKNLSNLRIL